MVNRSNAEPISFHLASFCIKVFDGNMVPFDGISAECSPSRPLRFVYRRLHGTIAIGFNPRPPDTMETRAFIFYHDGAVLID